MGLVVSFSRRLVLATMSSERTFSVMEIVDWFGGRLVGKLITGLARTGLGAGCYVRTELRMLWRYMFRFEALKSLSCWREGFAVFKELCSLSLSSCWNASLCLRSSYRQGVCWRSGWAD